MSETDKLASKAEPNPDTLARRQQEEGAMEYAWRRWSGALLLGTALLAGPGALAQKRMLINVPPTALELSDVNTTALADEFVRSGALVKVYLWPTELGGEDDPRNIVYITPEAAETRATIAGNLRRFLMADEANDVEVVPEYKGTSIVPTRIRFKARHKRGGAPFEQLVNIWH